MASRSTLATPRAGTFLLVLLALLPALALALYTGLAHRRSAAARLEADARRWTRLAVASEKRVVDGTRQLLVTLAELPDVRQGGGAACGRRLADLLRQYPQHANLGVVLPDGTLACSAVVPRERTSLADRRYVRRALETREFTPGEYQVDRPSGKPTVSFGYPMTSPGGRVEGVVFAALDLAWLNQVATEGPLPEGAALTMVDGSGTIVVHAPEPQKWVGMSMPYVPLVRAMLTQREGVTEETDVDGVRRLYAFAPVGDAFRSGLFLGVGISRSVALAEANRLLVGHLVALAAVVGLTVGGAWILGRRLGTLAATMEAEQAAKEALIGQVSDLVAERAHEVALLSQLGGLLQACFTVEEATAVVGRLVGQFFPDQGGALLVLDPVRSLLERVAFWGVPSPEGRPLFPPDECWALRRGQPYAVEATASGLLCPHLGSPPPPAYLCVPMVAQGQALGVLHLHARPGVPASFLGETKQRLAATVAEQLALSLANLRLRETLRAQSIRDPLTGLFNRRYMEETLDRELARAQRDRRPVGVIVLDVDHFKRVNDSFGHDAGDAVLAALGTLLRAQVRAGDIACRHGGEEFLFILPGASGEESRCRAGELQQATRELSVAHRGLVLGPVTFSVGVAAFPDHGATREALLRAADAALYRAKHEGRDRVVVAE